MSSVGATTMNMNTALEAPQQSYVKYPVQGGTVDCGGSTVLPADEYQLEVVESDYAANSKGTGMNLKLKCQVIGGEYAERVVYLNFGLEHKNEKWAAQEQNRFAAFRRAVGVHTPEDTEEFHFKAFSAVLGVEFRGDNGDAENVVWSYALAA
jgi:hypothetical protein